MSKGAGGRLGLRGGGGSGSGAGLRNIVSRLGVHNADYIRGGMRSLSTHRAAYAGKTAAQANRIATGRSLTNEGKKFAPVRIEISPTKGGKRQISLTDGRHRMTAAREAGATHIRATVVEYGAKGGKLRTWTGVVKI